MAKLIYDAESVQDTLVVLNNGSSCLDGTTAALNKAATTVYNAKNIHWIGGLDFSQFIKMPATFQGFIDEQVNVIKTKAAIIESYNGDNEATGLLKNVKVPFYLKFGEGLLTAGEHLFDGFLSLSGLAVGIFNKDAKKSISSFVEKDLVGDLFDKIYSNDKYKDNNKFGAIAADGTAGKVFKTLGIGTGYILQLMTGGLGAVAISRYGAIKGKLKSGKIDESDIGEVAIANYKDVISDLKDSLKTPYPNVPADQTDPDPIVDPTPEPTPDPTPTPPPKPTRPGSSGGDSGGSSNSGGGSDTKPPVSDTDPTKPTPIPSNPDSKPGNSGGGGYDSNNGFTGEDNKPTEPSQPDDIGNSIGGTTGKPVTIPSSSKPISTTTTTKGRKSIIPIIAGLGAATIAGIGTKAYLDKKDEEKSDDDIETEEWSGDEELDLEYTPEDLTSERDYLSPTDAQAYDNDLDESYEAVENNEVLNEE